MKLSRQKIDFDPAHRVVLAALAAGIFSLSFAGFLRWLSGAAPPTPWVRDFALSVHLVTVMAALPLGAWIFLNRKGGKRHKVLGYVWLGLMFTTAVATIFVRNLNDGRFSLVHLLTVLTFFGVAQAFLSARRGDIEAHRRHLRNFFLGALVIAGTFTFVPGRTMWQWLFDTSATVAPARS